MATSTISINGTFGLVNNQRIQFPLAFNYVTSGSNFIANAVNVATGSWQTIDQGSNSDFRIGAFTNTDISASIRVAINSTASYFVLQPGDTNLYTFNTSSILYAYSYGVTGSNAAVLNYLVSEK